MSTGGTRMTPGEHVGPKLHELLRARGYSPERFSRELGVSQAIVDGWLSGKLPESSDYHRIAYLLRSDLDEFLPASELQRINRSSARRGTYNPTNRRKT